MVYRTVYSARRSRAKLKDILLHLILGCISSVLIWVVFLIHWRARRRHQESLPNYRPVIEALANTDRRADDPFRRISQWRKRRSLAGS